MSADVIQHPTFARVVASSARPFHFVSRELFEQLTEFEKGAVENRLIEAIESQLIQRTLKGTS